ncbi:MAG: hypothetical protein IT168_01010 [Bryobacterales bacterium]|nr:hypothetical protein [Bryobacterales bacterium]
MLVALMLLAAAADWAPVRWPGSDPKSIDLVKGTAVNCLLLEQKDWSADFSAKAAEAGIATLGVLRPGEPLDRLAERLTKAKLNGAVLEGNFDDAAVAPVRAGLKDSRLALVELTARVKMRFGSDAPVLGTFQGVWPGINLAEDGTAKAAPSGAPWIDTNSGFLRFVRTLSNAGIWIAYQPPKGVTTLARYLQAIGDAAMVGARWVVTFDPDFGRRLMEGESKARADWMRMADTLRFYEQHKNWTRMDSLGKLAIVQDIDSGGLMSGGILDMISVKHTPVRPVPGRLLTASKMEGANMAVNVDPSALDEQKKEILKKFTRAGGTLLTAPPGWKFPAQRADQITLDKKDIEILDQIWKEVNSMTGRHNLGARLFNVSSMLSNLVGAPTGHLMVLMLVNYSDFAVENVTAHVLGKYSKATLYEPGGEPKPAQVYENEEGTGVDIAKVGQIAALVLE